MKILILCAGDRSEYSIALNCIRFIKKTRLDQITVCVLDKNKQILKYLKKNKIKHFYTNPNKFLNKVQKQEYDWLLNIWGYKILKKDFLKKFENNLNLHPAYLPYNRGRDPYYFSVIDQTPVGICIHRMDETVDGGRYYLRKKFNLKFPVSAGMIFDICLKEIKKMFIKNWVSIRNKKIKFKKYPTKIYKVNKRKELIKNNFIDLDKKINKSNKSFVLNCIAQDFNFLKMQVKLFGKIYDCKLLLKQSKKKRW